MADILIYGDSLTWGHRPDGQGRHAPEHRWPNALATALPGHTITAHGLRGRTTAFDQTASSADMNGAAILPTILHSHAPLDLVMILLGTNDIYFEFGARRALHGIKRLVEIIRHHPFRTPDATVPAVMLIAPPPLVPAADVTSDMIGQSQSYPAGMAALATELDCAFFDAGSVIETSPTDGIHFDAQPSQTLGTALADPVRTYLTTLGKA
jgi:lysophospholipase L1-like esterase